MGAWGPGVFENDDASDWVWELEDDTDGAILAEALGFVVDFPADEQVESPESSNALAAAEIIASAQGIRSLGLPTEAVAWLDAHSAAVDDRLRSLALAAVTRIGADSELKDLWDEAHDPAWAEAVAALQARLR